MKIGVIGAGVAGLSCALACRQRGHEVEVFEQAEALAEVGAGLQISPNGMAVLQDIGLTQDIQKYAQPIDCIHLSDGLTDRSVVRMGLDHLARGYGAFHRADLVQMIFDACKSAGVGFHFAAPHDGGMIDGFDLIVGADGLHSPVRAALNGPGEPLFTGHVAWRALVPAVGHTAAEARVAMGPGRHVVSYPLRGGRLINVVAIEERAQWAVESWSAKGDPRQMRQVFAGFGPRTRALLAEVSQCYEWGLFRHPIAARWHDGRKVALIGDAAHPTLPFMAQGANMALEDAWVLAQQVTMHDVTAGLVSYERLRRARVTRALAAAQANAMRYHLANPMLRKVAHVGLSVLGRAAPGFLPSRFDWLYGHDVTQAHQ